MFELDDWVEILVALDLSTKYKTPLVGAMTSIDIDSPELVPIVLGLTNSIKELKQAILTERSNPNSALIKADVLEWSEGKRATGMIRQKEQLQKELFNLLNLEEWGISLRFNRLPGTGNTKSSVNLGW